jgi:microtubule-associated serine/threonine kinase
MEECLAQFIEVNQLDEVDVELDGTARFVQHQVVELARDCLEKSRTKLISSTYFYELSENLERLRRDVREI